MQTFSREYEKGDPRIRTTLERLVELGVNCFCDKSSWEPGPVKIECWSALKHFGPKQLRFLKHLNFTEEKN